MTQPSKKTKTYHYHAEWEQEFFFIMMKDKCLCLICNSNVALPKKANVERHFRTVHHNYEIDFPLNSEVRKEKVKQLKSQLGAQQTCFTKFSSKSKTATVASFKVANILIKHKKPFGDGEIWKEAFVKAGEVLFKDFKNKSEILESISNMSLTRNTIMQRTVDISKNLEDILQQDIQKCCFLSLQFDESTDITDTAQLCIFIRMVFEDMSTTEELLTILPMKGHTRGQDIYNLFESFISRTDFPIHKLVSITTDGAPSMIGKHVGFVTLCKKDEKIPSFHSYHCIIHQQTLCSKVLNSNYVMNIAFKIVNSIRARSLQRRQFRTLLEQCEIENTELLLHTDVRWLSRAKFLKRFRDLLPEIKQFLTGREELYPELEDKSWLMALAFLCDMTEHLNKLNLQLQGKHKSILDMITAVKTFKEKLSMFIRQLELGDLKHFQNMEEESNDEPGILYNEYANQISTLLNEFTTRFADFTKIENIATFMSFPFNDCINTEEIATQINEFLDSNSACLEDEIIALKCDIFIKSRATTEDKFWNLLSEEKYPILRRVAGYMSAFFGSTYLCESAFSSMNGIKTKHRSCLTDDHLASCLRIAISSYDPKYEELADKMQCHVSGASSSSSK